MDASVGTGRQTPWKYQDSKGDWHVTKGLKPIHFLKNAIEQHKGEYKKIADEYLKR